MKTCIECKTEIKRGICCERCNAVLDIMAVVTRHWRPDEMKPLRDMLRKEGVLAAHRDAVEAGKSIKAKLLWHIIEGAHLADCEPDVMRSKVCDAINREISNLETARKFDAENGEGAWDRRVATWISQSIVGALSGTKVEKKEEAA